MKILILFFLFSSLAGNIYLYKRNIDYAGKVFYLDNTLEATTEQLYFLIEYSSVGLVGGTLEGFIRFLKDNTYAYKQRTEQSGTYIFIHNLTFRFDIQGNFISVSAKG